MRANYHGLQNIYLFIEKSKINEETLNKQELSPEMKTIWSRGSGNASRRAETGRSGEAGEKQPEEERKEKFTESLLYLIGLRVCHPCCGGSPTQPQSL